MLTDLSQEVANCYQHAAECAERAGSCADGDIRTFYLEREEAWLLLARTYERSERAGQRLGEPKNKSVRNWAATVARVRNCQEHRQLFWLGYLPKLPTHCRS